MASLLVLCSLRHSHFLLFPKRPKMITANTYYYMVTFILILVAKIYSFINHHLAAKRCPISVNYHFTRQCNKSCGFCFHTATTSHRESLDNAKLGLTKLKRAGMRKLNFAGGEPFLIPDFLGELVRYCKEDLKLESVSIVSNGSLIKEAWFAKYGHNLDILAVSCDSLMSRRTSALVEEQAIKFPNSTRLRNGVTSTTPNSSWTLSSADWTCMRTWMNISTRSNFFDGSVSRSLW